MQTPQQQARGFLPVMTLDAASTGLAVVLMSVFGLLATMSLVRREGQFQDRAPSEAAATDAPWNSVIGQGAVWKGY